MDGVGGILINGTFFVLCFIYYIYRELTLLIILHFGTYKKKLSDELVGSK